MSKRSPPPPAERQNRSRAVADLLPAIGGAAFRRFGFVQSAVVTRWPEIVGDRLAAVSAPESIRFPMGKKEGGTLALVVKGAHAAMMSHVTPEIVERVNRFFGYAAVAKVAIRQGDVAPRAERRVAPTLKPAVDLGASLKTIADPELKAVLEALASGVAAAPALPPNLPKVR
nr:DciA family protein [Sphingomonas sp. Leaf412]